MYEVQKCPASKPPSIVDEKGFLASQLLLLYPERPTSSLSFYSPRRLLKHPLPCFSTRSRTNHTKNQEPDDNNDD